MTSTHVTHNDDSYGNGMNDVRWQRLASQTLCGPAADTPLHTPLMACWMNSSLNTRQM
jgi:hypothetical protein